MKTTFYCYFPDDGESEEDAVAVLNWDADDAARELAEYRDNRSGDGYRDEQIVCVRKGEDGEWERYRVTAEPDVHYSASLEDD